MSSEYGTFNTYGNTTPPNSLRMVMLAWSWGTLWEHPQVVPCGPVGHGNLRHCPPWAPGPAQLTQHWRVCHVGSLENRFAESDFRVWSAGCPGQNRASLALLALSSFLCPFLLPSWRQCHLAQQWGMWPLRRGGVGQVPGGGRKLWPLEEAGAGLVRLRDSPDAPILGSPHPLRAKVRWQGSTAGSGG